MTDNKIPHWIFKDDLLWRPSTVEYSLSWDNLRVLKGNSWLDTYKEGAHTYVRRNTDRLVPVVQRILGQRGIDELQLAESKGGFDAVTRWVVEVYQTASYAYLAHVPNLATAERDRPRSAKSVFKRVLDLDAGEKRELKEVWFDSLAWEFGKWREYIILKSETNGGPNEFSYGFWFGLVEGYCAIEFGPDDGVSRGDTVKSLTGLLLRAWLDARRKWIDGDTYYGLLAHIELLYLDLVPEFDPILEPDL